MESTNQSLSDAELIEEFINCAKNRGKGTLDGDDRKTMRAIYRMKALDEMFRARGHSAQSQLLPYLDNADEGVRYWSAKRLFVIDPVKSRAAIERVASGVGPIAAEARMTLSELDSGQFKPEALWSPIERKS